MSAAWSYDEPIPTTPALVDEPILSTPAPVDELIPITTMSDGEEDIIIAESNSSTLKLHFR